MAWTNYPLTKLPPDVAGLLPAALRSGRTFAKGRYEVDEGLELAINWSGYIHHSTVPTAAALDTLVDREAAARFHSNLRLVCVLEAIPNMDGREKRVLAAVGGTDLQVESYLPPTIFATHLFPLVDRPTLRPFFEIQAARRDHYDVRPIEPLTLAKRAKALNPTDRILLVTIVGLYNSDLARDGFKRDWNPPAVEAFERINALRTSDPDIPPHFYGLLASYPGW
jgi:hypothetical protein